MNIKFTYYNKMTECVICFKKIKNKLTKCPFCDFECCSFCLLQYLKEKKNIQCINTDCSKKLELFHLKNNVNTSHFNTIKNLLIDWEYEKQMSILDITSPLVQFYNKYDLSVSSLKNNKMIYFGMYKHYKNNCAIMSTIDSILSIPKSNSVISNEITLEIRSKALQKKITVEKEIKTLEDKIKVITKQNKTDEIFIVKFKVANGLDMIKSNIILFPCPKYECNGFVVKSSKKCNICGIKCCHKCETIITEKRHTCQPSTLESIIEINKTTKKCPKCSTRIYRTEGCNHMWCSKCYTGFDYKTRKIIEDHKNTNPHLAEFIKNNKNYRVRNRQDLICGGINNDENLYDNTNPWNKNVSYGFLRKAERYIYCFTPFIIDYCGIYNEKTKVNLNKFTTENCFIFITRILFLIKHLEINTIPHLREKVIKTDLYQDQRVNFIRKKINKEQFLQEIRKIKNKNEEIIFLWQLLETLNEIIIPETNHFIEELKEFVTYMDNNNSDIPAETKSKLPEKISKTIVFIEKYFAYYEEMLRVFDYYNTTIIDNYPQLKIFDLSQIFLGRNNKNDSYIKKVQYRGAAGTHFEIENKKYDHYLQNNSFFVPHSTFLRDHYDIDFIDEEEKTKTIPYPIIKCSYICNNNIYHYRYSNENNVYYDNYVRQLVSSIDIPFMYDIKQDFSSGYILKEIINKRITLTQYEKKKYFNFYNNKLYQEIPENLKLLNKKGKTMFNL